MPATVENQAITTSATGTSRTITSFAVGNNPDRTLYVCMVSFSTTTPHETHDSVVFNASEGLTKIADRKTDSDDFRMTIWRKINPSVATADIVGTASASISIALAAVSVKLIHQTTPNGTVADNSAMTGDPTTVTFDSVTGDLGINFSLSEYGVNSHGAGQTQIVIENTGWGFTSSSKDGGASTTTMTENLAGSGASWIAIGLALKGSQVDPSVGLNFNVLRPAIFSPGLAR
jgi:hypothetical protein